MWNKVSEKELPYGEEVIAFNKEWIDEDSNPNGTRVGFLGGRGFIMEPKKPIDDHDRLDPGHKIGLLILLFIFMLFVTRACAQTAQYDTAIVKYQNIERIVSQTTDKGAVRYYAVYNDKQENISELIPVSKTVLSYINACKQNQIEPSLAIRLKNGIIVGLIRYKTKYIVKRRR